MKGIKGHGSPDCYKVLRPGLSEVSLTDVNKTGRRPGFSRWTFLWAGEKEGSLVSGWPWWETRPQREGQYRLEKKTGHTSKDIYIYGIYIVFKQSANAVFTPRQLFFCLFVFPVLDFSVMFENTKTTNQEQGCANELTNPTSLLRATIESQCWTKMTTCSPKLPSVVLPYCRRG